MKCLSHIVVGAELPTNTQNKLIANFATQNGIELGFSLADRIEYPTSTIMAVRRFAEPGSHCLDPIITAYFPAAAELMAKLIPVFYCGEVRSDMMGISAENGDGLAEPKAGAEPKAEPKAEESLLTKAMSRRESIARRAAQMRDDGIDYGEISRKLLGDFSGRGGNAGRIALVKSLLGEYDGGGFDGKRYSAGGYDQPGSDFLKKHAAYHAQVKAYFDDCLMSTEVAKKMADNHGIFFSNQTAAAIYRASRNGDFENTPPAIGESDLPKQAELIGTTKDVVYPHFAENGDLVLSHSKVYSLVSARRHAKIAEECAKLRKKGRTHNEIVAVITKKLGYKISATTAGAILAAHKAGMFNRI